MRNQRNMRGRRLGAETATDPYARFNPPGNTPGASPYAPTAPTNTLPPSVPIPEPPTLDPGPGLPDLPPPQSGGSRTGLYVMAGVGALALWWLFSSGDDD